jgi:PAS domain S-box-containing protein
LFKFNRKKAEAASGPCYEALLKASGDMVCSWLPDTTLTYVSPGYCKCFGKSEAELLGHRWLELVPEEIQGKLPDLIADLVRNPRVHKHQTSAVAADGKAHWMEWLDMPRFDEHGRLLGFDSLGRDSSLSNQLHASLEKKLVLEQLQAKISAALGGNLDFDAAIDQTLAEIGRVCAAHRTYLFLLRDDGLTVDNTHEWCAPGVKPQIDHLQNIPMDSFPWWMARLRAGQAFVIETLADLPPEAGAERELLESQDIKSLLSFPVNAGGQLAGFIGFDNVFESAAWQSSDLAVLQMTANFIGQALGQRRAERSLRQSEERLRTMVEASEDCILVVDRDLNYLYANRASKYFLGVEGEDLTGRNMGDLFSSDPETLERWTGRITQVLQTGQPISEQEGRNKVLGRDVCCRWTLSPLLAHDGGVSSVCLVYRDITAESEIENQLRQVLKLEAVGQLAGGVAHDFNNLLMVIQGCSGFMDEELPEDSPLREDLNDIIDAGKKGEVLTRQLLTFSRKQKIKTCLVDFNTIVRDLEKMLGRLIREDIQLTIKTCSQPLTLEVDPGQMEQVLVNLVVNARDAMPNGGNLTIVTERTELDASARRYLSDPRDFVAGPYVMLAVSDSGMGMPPEVKARIFDPFFTTKGKLGTGLGLATLYGIIKQHGGFVAVYSELGHGTSFKVYLPLQQDSVAIADQAAELATAAKGQGTVLLVEDELMVRRVISRTLEKLGYCVLEATNGNEGLELLEEKSASIDLVLTDMVMPGMNGDVLIEQARRRYPKLKFILMSGYPEKHAGEGAGALAVEILTKPVASVALAAKVREVLSN